MSNRSKTVPLEKMWRVIEGYGIKRDLLEKSHPTHEEVLRLYQLIKKNKALRRDIRQVKHLQEYNEKLSRNKS